jgi:hypothetical protein
MHHIRKFEIFETEGHLATLSCSIDTVSKSVGLHFRGCVGVQQAMKTPSVTDVDPFAHSTNGKHMTVKLFRDLPTRVIVAFAVEREWEIDPPIIEFGEISLRKQALAA